MPGVSGTSVGWWTSSLLIQYSPSLISPPELIRLVERALDDPGGWGAEPSQPNRTRFGLANVTLGIAALADFVVPALMLVSAVLLVGTNVRTFQAAWLQIRRRKFGLPVLYTAIASTALASGQFFSCALMSLFYKFWHHRLRLELTSERRRLLDECLPRPSSTCLITPEGSEVLVSVDRLRPGDRVVVQAGEAVPADGKVIGGEGIVDERSVRRPGRGIAKASGRHRTGRFDRTGRHAPRRGLAARRGHSGILDRPGHGRGDESRSRSDLVDASRPGVRGSGRRAGSGDGGRRPAGR